jgi:hypothetical protein
MGDLSCQRFTDLLGEHVEGALGSDEEAAMAAHALTCSRCSELRADYERLPGVVRRATDAAMPPGAKARLRRLLSRAWWWHR